MREPVGARALIERAMEQLRGTQKLSPRKRWDSPRRVAESLGYEDADSQAKVYNWMDSPSGPPYRDTVLLLDLCGFLTPEGRAFLGLADLAQVEAAVDLATETGADLRRRRGRDERREAAS